MGDWISRARKEWLIVAEIILLGLFAAGDSAGVVKDFVGREAGPGLITLAAILIIGITALTRLGRLRETLERYESRVRILARPGSMSWNHPDPGPGKFSLRTSIRLELWTDIDVHTSALVLNIVGLRIRKRWQVWDALRRTSQPLMGLRPKGQDTPIYRKAIRAADTQPFQDDIEFEYDGPLLNWDGIIMLILVLQTGSPTGRFTSVVDSRLWERGSRSPL